ncbi:MAG: hypothetical protein K8S25_13035 [Alphaproteobacteria bacterium]|nr:hypothetical protein [Alphaproteobacteria bacterium]
MRSRVKKRLFCSFCRKSDAQVAKLIGGPGVNICDVCVDQCNAILAGRPSAGFAGWESLSDEALLAALPPSEASVEAARGILQTQIEILRKRDVSWAQIGEALKISRQAAWERFA